MLLVRSGGGARLCLVERLDARPRDVSEIILSIHGVVWSQGRVGADCEDG